jgi:hypothetical protein
MKKLLLSMFLMTGTLSFASTGKIIDPIKEKSNASLYTCQVGDWKFDSAICGCDPCAAAHKWYDAEHGTNGGYQAPNSYSNPSSTGGGAGGSSSSPTSNYIKYTLHGV